AQALPQNRRMTNRSHLNTSLPLQTSLQHAARDCFTALEHRIASLVGDEPLSADHADRNELLEQKHVLSSQMEELRATMRNVQEDGEHCSDQARQFEAEGALDLIKVAAQRDKLQTLREQLQRSRQQAVEHRRAERELRAEIERAKATFHEVISVELEVQAAVRNEIGQLRQVVQDLAARIETKMDEISRLEQANEWAAAEVSSAAQRWRETCLERRRLLRSGEASLRPASVRHSESK
ncbi:unnamed protein product, partial [Effrenium voratum]